MLSEIQNGYQLRNPSWKSC